MNRRAPFILTAVSTFILTATFAHAEDWTRFRGNGGEGVASKPVPTEWSPDKNIKWQVDLPGAGVSCPIVIGDKIFLTTYTGYGEDRANLGNPEDLQRHLVCLDRKTGKELWKKTVDAADNEDAYRGMGVPEHGYASHTPVSDGESVFAFFGKSGVYAYDLDGKELWNKKVGTGSDDRGWGSASSPVLFKNVVIVPAICESVAIYGFDKKTGKELWKQEADGLRMSWATPQIVKAENGQEDLVIGVPNEIWGMNPETGKLRWLCSGLEGNSFYTSTTAKDGIVYASVGGRMGGGSIAVKAGGKKDVTESHVVWTGNDQTSYATPVVHKGHMFLLSRGTATVVNAKDGKQVKKQRLSTSGSSGGGGRRGRGSDYSSPVVAGDHLYYIKRNGDTHVYTADAEFKEVSVNSVTKDNEIFSASPVVVDGQLLLRSDKKLYCIE